MIGWKINYNDTVCEIVGMPMVNSETDMIIIPIYHNKMIKMAYINNSEGIKVIERK